MFIVVGLFMGYRREAAARYPFLLAIPAVLASGAFEVKDSVGEGHVAWARPCSRRPSRSPRDTRSSHGS